MSASSRFTVAMCLLLAGCSADNPAGDGGRDGALDATGDAAGRCDPGVDSDSDGLTNDRECQLGSDPFNRDTDGDGLLDGVEGMYPRICVADDRAAQRRPPPACTTDMECSAGEHCRGLDPASSDSDGDGVPDATEDPNRDGTINQAGGETDPRLWDTDGDGMNDGMGGVEICRPSGLASVTQQPVPMGPIQVGHDPAWGAARTVAGTGNRGAAVLDDASANVAGVVFTRPSTGDVAAEAAAAEMTITTALGAGTSAVLVGRSLTTHDMNPAIASTYRVARATSASALRDALVMPMIGAAAPAGSTVGASSEFLVDISTTRRTMGPGMGHTDVVVTIAPRSDYDDPTRPTAIRATDLVNTTAVAEADATLSFDCQVFRGGGSSLVDFLWTVDVSVSMGPYQQRVGQTAQRFFTDLTAAGVDFRVAVLAAQSQPFNFVTPGLHWVSSGAANGANELAYRVTVEPFSMMAADTLAPYPNNGMFVVQLDEEPIAGAIIAYDQLAMGSTTGAAPDLRLRDGAATIAFFVADETGNNDEMRYFGLDTARWGTGYPAHLASAVQWFQSHHIIPFGLVNHTATPTCSMTDPRDMRRCVILGAGGAWIPIDTATDADVAAAMTRIVAAVAGASSQYRLNRSPITSTIKLRVRGMDVPRSRSDGFDYDPASRSVVFFGSTYRPHAGDEVVISYRVWEGSLG